MQEDVARRLWQSQGLEQTRSTKGLILSVPLSATRYFSDKLVNHNKTLHNSHRRHFQHPSTLYFSSSNYMLSTKLTVSGCALDTRSSHVYKHLPWLCSSSSHRYEI